MLASWSESEVIIYDNFFDKNILGEMQAVSNVIYKCLQVAMNAPHVPNPNICQRKQGIERCQIQRSLLG